MEFHYLTDLLRVPVEVEGEPGRPGRLLDVGIRKSGGYPFVSSLKIRGPGSRPTVEQPWSAVRRLDRRRVVLSPTGAGEPPGADVWLRRDLLDDQVIDVSGSKVVRVNDLHLLHAEGRLVLVHVDVGMLGILRRLRFARLVTGLLRWLFDYELKETLVPWRFVELVGSESGRGPVRMAAAPDRLVDMHPAELADIMEQLGTIERNELLDQLPLEAAAEALEEADDDVQRAYLVEQDPGKAADLLEEMSSTEAADVLRDLHASDAQRILAEMEKKAAEGIRAILAHEETTAGGIMSTSCVVAPPERRADEVLHELRTVSNEAEVFNQIYVVDEAGRLLGVMSLRELLLADPSQPARSVMRTDVISVGSEAGLEEVAGRFVKYAFRAIPVVDADGRFLGAIRLVRVLSKLSGFFPEEE